MRKRAHVICERCQQELCATHTAAQQVNTAPKRVQSKGSKALLWASRVAVIIMFFVAEVVGMYWWAANNVVSGDSSLDRIEIAVPATAPETAQLAPTATPVAGQYTGAVSGGTYTLAIQKLGLRAPIVPVGKTANGNMDTTPSLYQVAWYKLGPRPGQQGSVVLAAHYGAPDQAGVFRQLGDLNPGDQLTIVVKDNPNLTYQVVKKESYPVNNAPLNAIFGPNGKAGLNLITCYGNWDANSRTYDQRLVIYTELVK